VISSCGGQDFVYAVAVLVITNGYLVYLTYVAAIVNLYIQHSTCIQSPERFVNYVCIQFGTGWCESW
jgi:hypothetical protein